MFEGSKGVNCVRRARSALGTLCLCALAVGCSTASDPTSFEEQEQLVTADPIEFSLQPLKWEVCDPELGDVECAVAVVPLDYDRPHGAKTGIALARAKAWDQDNKLGTVFVNPGGPGGAGVDLILSGFGDDLVALLGGRFDVVGFDPRGVGSSEPMRCFDTEQELLDFINEQPSFPYTFKQEADYFTAGRVLTKKCLSHGGRITTHMSTTDVARDLDRLRQYVRDKKLTYLGFSYGSQIGNTYAALFPKNIRALAIDGVLDPEQWSNGTTTETDAEASGAVFDEFARLCDEAGDACAFGGPIGAKARFEALAEKFLQAPLVLEDQIYTYDLLIFEVLSSLYAPETWGGDFGLAALLAVVEELKAGDTAQAPKALQIRQSLKNRLHTSSTREQEQYSNDWEAYSAVRCADAEFPRSFAGWHKGHVAAAKASRFGPLWWWSTAACADWPASPDRYQGAWSTRTSAPVLVVGNYFDPATGYKGALASNKFMRNSRLLSYAGWGHCAFGRSACATDYILSYLYDGSLPPAGTVCPANESPFVVEPEAEASDFARSIVTPSLPPIGRPPVRPGQR